MTSYQMLFSWYTVKNPTSYHDFIFLSIKAGVCTGENQVASGIFKVYHDEKGIAYTLLYSMSLDMTRYLKIRNLDITDKLVEGHL